MPRHFSPNPLMRQTPAKQQQASKEKSAKPKAATMVARRIRFILHQLETGELTPDDLRKNLEYAALVLETAYMDDHRKLLDEEDDQEDFVPDEMPTEVREWLSATFTKQTSKRNQKLKFKSVANAIRSGIVFDNDVQVTAISMLQSLYSSFYHFQIFQSCHIILVHISLTFSEDQMIHRIFRRISISPQVHIPGHVAEVLQHINSWEFDVFRLNESSENSALKYIGLDLFQRYNLFAKYKISISALECFLHHLEFGYSKHDNPYHNLIHAADVTQTCHWMMSQTGLLECLNELEVFACIFAAMIHDFEHTGHTNNFHIQSLSDFAILYNDRSVLENHHVSAVFRFMREDPDSNILSSLTKEDFREFRQLVIEMVLSTDMSTHFGQIKLVKSMLSLPEGIDKHKALCLIVHCCDISHPAKVWPVHYKWTMSVLEEFFRQGDLESSMGLPFSPLCDRHTTHVAESQIGFIDFIVEPTMIVCAEMLNKLIEPMVIMPSFDDTSSNHSSASPNRLESPDPSTRSPSPRSLRRLPMGADGKLNIPQPFLKILQENKNRWKERAVIEDRERKALKSEEKT